MKSCEERIAEKLASTVETLGELWRAAQTGDEDAVVEFEQHHLDMAYVPLGSYHDQEEPYFRYQLSWGGPSDEFRYFVDKDFDIYRIEYWFLDWWDGASRRLFGDDRALLTEIWEYHFKESADEITSLDAEDTHD